MGSILQPGFVYWDGFKYILSNASGPPGPAGSTGATGATGATGSPGADGSPGPGSSVVFQPGGVDNGNTIFTTWSQIQQQIENTLVPLTVIMDGTFNSNAVTIPTGLTECGTQQITFAPVTKFTEQTTLFIADGAVIDNLYAIDGTPAGEAGFQVEYDCTTTPCFTFTNENGETSNVFFATNTSFACFTGNNVAISLPTTGDVGSNLHFICKNVEFTSQNMIMNNGTLYLEMGGVTVSALDGTINGSDGSAQLIFAYNNNINGGSSQYSVPIPIFTGFPGTIAYQTLVPDCIPTGNSTAFGGFNGPTYYAHANELVHVDTTDGYVIIVLPSMNNLTPGTKIIIKCVTMNTNPVHVITQDSATIDGTSVSSFVPYQFTPSSFLLTVTFIANPQASNWDVVSLPLVPPVYDTLIFQPGSPYAAGNIYSTWSLLMAARNNIIGAATIIIDTSFTSPAVITPGVWNLQPYSSTGVYSPTKIIGQGNSNNNVNNLTSLQVQGTLLNPSYFENLAILGISGGAINTSSSVLAFTAQNTTFGNSSGTPLMTSPGGTIDLYGDSTFQNPESSFILRNSTGGTTILNLHDNAQIVAGSVAITSGSAHLVVNIQSPLAYYQPMQQPGTDGITAGSVVVNYGNLASSNATSPFSGGTLGTQAGNIQRVVAYVRTTNTSQPDTLYTYSVPYAATYGAVVMLEVKWTARDPSGLTSMAAGAGLGMAAFVCSTNGTLAQMQIQSAGTNLIYTNFNSSTASFNKNFNLLTFSNTTTNQFVTTATGSAITYSTAAGGLITIQVNPPGNVTNCDWTADIYIQVT